MTESIAAAGFTDAEWAVWEPLVEAVRPRGRTMPKDPRRTVAAILWRHRNGATWRAVPAALGPWSQAAQLFIRWARAGAWERLLDLAQKRAGGLELGLAFLGGTTIRAHGAAQRSVSQGPLRRPVGAPKKKELAQAETSVKRLAALAAASATSRSDPPHGSPAKWVQGL